MGRKLGGGQMSGFSIQKADLSHLGRLVELERLCFADPWGEADLSYELNDPLCLWLVAVDETGTVRAYAGSRLVLDEADIMNIAVVPELRRQGLGSRLLAELLHRLTAGGARVVTLEVRESNAPARAMYERFGFVQAGLRPNYYSHPREHALLLRRELEVET